MPNEEGRRDIFVLRSIYVTLSEPLKPSQSYGLFQYFKGKSDITYTVRTPVRFMFPTDAKNLGELVALHEAQIQEDAGTNFMNFTKKGYFPDQHFASGEGGYTIYEDLDKEDLSQFRLGYNYQKFSLKK